MHGLGVVLISGYLFSFFSLREFSFASFALFAVPKPYARGSQTAIVPPLRLSHRQYGTARIATGTVLARPEA